MFLNYLPSEMVEVVGLTMIFSFLVGTILILLFTSDQANTKNLYLNLINIQSDLENLRESYIAKQIFNIGDRVENLNTGMIGRIIRRGANHLICVSENNIMFKSWVKDLQEAIINAKTPSGVPANQRLTGTDALRKYVETMVPGISYGKQFINKYKVRK